MMIGAAADRLRRMLAAWPHWVWPLAVGAVFGVVGGLALDDYAVISDTVYSQRPIASSAVALALGREPAPLGSSVDRLYGAAFELLPFGVERIFSLDDTRAIYLSRYLITHLFFIAGGFCGYLLTYRMTGSRLLGLFAMLLFLLHPRMYGNSFFNSKDVPFLSMFMIALLGAHWAFLKGTVGAFLALGAAVGILVNLRIMGVMLLPAVLALRACDVYYAAGGAERWRAAMGGAAFALTAAGVYYVSMPYLWSDPIGRFGEIITQFARHTIWSYDLFQGRYVYSGALPAHYVPVWIGITTPVWALVLAGVGAVGICGAAIRRAGGVLRDTALRFELLLVCSATLPIIAVIALRSAMYNDWRHLYFLWAPLCLLAALGLQRLGAGLGVLLRHSGRGWNPAVARVALAGLAAAALAGVAADMVRLHPYQHLYFNWTVDRTTPEHLKTQYEMDYFHTARREGHQYILDHHPDAAIQLEWRGAEHTSWRHLETFSAAERQRFRLDREVDADYYVLNRAGKPVSPPGLAGTLLPPLLYSREVYGSTIMSVATPDLSRVDPATADTYREIYRATVRQSPTLRAEFDFYLNDQTLTLVNENCGPGVLSGAYRLRVYPADPDDLPQMYHSWGHIHDVLYGVRFDGKCLMQATLPDYVIARIVVVAVGETRSVGEILSDDYRAALRWQYAALSAREPSIRADWAVYVDAGGLRYIKDECRPEDTAAPFFLHIVPELAESLPPERREYGYDADDFEWDDWSARGDGVMFDGKCMATARLPAYDILSIRTGQFRSGAGPVWSGEFDYQAAQASRYGELAAGAPTARDFFSVWHGGGALTYIREDCGADDTAAAFFLHLIPADLNDLREGRREHGFANRDFAFAAAGGVKYAGRCLVSVPLPEYAIVGVRTGQYTPEAGRLWEVEFAVAEQRPAP